VTVTQPKRLNLIELLKAANTHYADSYLSLYFDMRSGAPKRGYGDTLAEFIVRELRESFDERFSREQQVTAAVSALERAKEDIQDAIEGLREL